MDITGCKGNVVYMQRSITLSFFARGMLQKKRAFGKQENGRLDMITENGRVGISVPTYLPTFKLIFGHKEIHFNSAFFFVCPPSLL